MATPSHQSDADTSQYTDALRTLVGKAAALLDDLVRQEVNVAKRHGYAPTITFPIQPSDNPDEHLSQLENIIEELAAGRSRAYERLEAAPSALSQAAPASAETPAPTLRSRVDFLIDTLDGEEPPPINEEDTWKDRLNLLEQQANQRQTLIESLLDKAYQQGQVIGDLRAEMERMAAASPSERAALVRLNTDTIAPDEFVVIHEDNPEEQPDV